MQSGHGSKDEQIAWPLNTVRIFCRRPDRTCEIGQAQVDLDDNGAYLSALPTTVWNVRSWSDTEVVAISSGACRNNTLTLNWATDTAFTVSTDTSGEGCELFGKQKGPIFATLENGFDLSRDFFAARKLELRGTPLFLFEERMAANISPKPTVSAPPTK